VLKAVCNVKDVAGPAVLKKMKTNKDLKPNSDDYIVLAAIITFVLASVLALASIVKMGSNILAEQPYSSDWSQQAK
jgi:hypothetical protein